MDGLAVSGEIVTAGTALAGLILIYIGALVTSYGSFAATEQKMVGQEFVGHGVVKHSLGEYGRSGVFHTNTIEGYFALLKRGIIGVYHHVSEAHLKRYCVEFDFRWNTRKLNDFERAEEALKGITGKRLAYRRTHQLAA